MAALKEIFPVLSESFGRAAECWTHMLRVPGSIPGTGSSDKVRCKSLVEVLGTGKREHTPFGVGFSAQN